MAIRSVFSGLQRVVDAWLTFRDRALCEGVVCMCDADAAPLRLEEPTLVFYMAPTTHPLRPHGDMTIDSHATCARKRLAAAQSMPSPGILAHDCHACSCCWRHSLGDIPVCAANARDNALALP